MTPPVVIVLLGFGASSWLACDPQGRSPSDDLGAARLGIGKQGVDDSGWAPPAHGVAPYPFKAAPLTWAEQQKLTAKDAGDGDRFGGHLALSADTAFVGAISHDGVGADSGAAYVFVRTARSWGLL